LEIVNGQARSHSKNLIPPVDWQAEDFEYCDLVIERNGARGSKMTERNAFVANFLNLLRFKTLGLTGRIKQVLHGSAQAGRAPGFEIECGNAGVRGAKRCDIGGCLEISGNTGRYRKSS
jgi:hypothetical protein